MDDTARRFGRTATVLIAFLDAEALRRRVRNETVFRT